MPPPDMAGASFFFGVSATIASVVIMRLATDAVLQSNAHNLRWVDDAGA